MTGEAAMIDTSGEWWRGDDFTDVAEYLREYAAEGYPVDHISESICVSCGGRSFRLVINALSNDGARRTCITCGNTAFIADSADYWEEDEVEPVLCPCGGDIFQVAVGFALREAKDDVKWISVGTRCVADGVLASPVDWKVSHGPSLHLIHQA